MHSYDIYIFAIKENFSKDDLFYLNKFSCLDNNIDHVESHVINDYARVLNLNYQSFPVAREMFAEHLMLDEGYRLFIDHILKD